MAFTSETGRQWGKIGGTANAAINGNKTLARKGQQGLLNKFRNEVDPEGALDPEERAKRVRELHRAHMMRLSVFRLTKRRNARIAAGTI